MSKCIDCGCNFVTAPESPVPEGQRCKYCEIKALRAQLDQANAAAGVKDRALRTILSDFQKQNQSTGNYSDGEYTEDYTTRHELLEKALSTTAGTAILRELEQLRADLGDAINQHNALADIIRDLRSANDQLRKERDGLREEVERLLLKDTYSGHQPPRIA